MAIVSNKVFVFLIFTTSAQDRGSFCLFHIMNEILLNIEVINTFVVGNHCPNLFGKFQN